VVQDFFLWHQTKSGQFISSNYDFEARSRRQDIEKQYVENGSFYVIKPEALSKTGNRLSGKIGVIEMEFWKMFEIDDENDLRICSALMNEFLLEE
jgi:N-acylneuraminate cytidylyltransferase